MITEKAKAIRTAKRKARRIEILKEKISYNSRVYDYIFDLIVQATGEEKKMLLHVEDLLNTRGIELRKTGVDDEEND